MAGLSEWLQLKHLGYSIKLVYSTIGTIGFQYVYFPILSLVSFAYTVLFFSSFPVEGTAKKLLFVRTNFRTLYEFLETTMFFLFCLTATSDISQWLGFEPAPASPNVIPFTPTMWMEYFTLNLAVLPAYFLLYLFLYDRASSISLSRIASWVLFVGSLGLFITNQGTRFALSQIWIFGTICVYWGIATAASIVTRKR